MRKKKADNPISKAYLPAEELSKFIGCLKSSIYNMKLDSKMDYAERWDFNSRRMRFKKLMIFNVQQAFEKVKQRKRG